MNKLIVVDVHELYLDYINFNISELVQTINHNYDKVLIFYVGNETCGEESENDIRHFYYEHGLDDNAEITYIDKGFGFLRDWMDSGFDVVTAIKTLLAQNITDIREIPSELFEKVFNEELNQEDYCLYLPDFIDTLQEFEGADICGGSEQQCLEEVKLLMDGCGIEYNVLCEYVY